MNKFFSAVETQNLIQLESLLSEGFDINAKDEYGYSGLHIGSSKNLVEVCLFLIKHGIDLNTQDKNGQTILHYTAVYNQSEVAIEVLNRGGDLSIEDNYGNHPLWTAVFNDKGKGERTEIIKIFMEGKADINHKNKVGKSPRDIILIGGYHNLDFLLT